jgi:bifunctional non-homologous end joining protein LigD
MAAPTAPTVDGAMQTPDGAWRVEAVHTGTSHWYRAHGDNAIDWLTIVDVERLLQQAGVDISDLHDAVRPRKSQKERLGRFLGANGSARPPRRPPRPPSTLGYPVPSTPKRWDWIAHRR